MMSSKPYGVERPLPASDAIKKPTEVSAADEAILSSAVTLLDEATDFSPCVRKIAGKLHSHASDPLVARVMFNLALVEASAHRTRFAALVLSKHGYVSMASFLVRRALSSGAKKWDVTALRSLEPVASSADSAKGKRRVVSIAIRGGTLHCSCISDAVEAPEPFKISDVNGVLLWIAKVLREGGPGVCRDLVELEIEDTTCDLEPLLTLLSSMSLFPVSLALTVPSAEQAATMVAAFPARTRQLLSPVVTVRKDTDSVFLVTAGGGSLYEVGELDEYVLKDSAHELRSLGFAAGLLNLYRSPVLASERSRLIMAFRDESHECFPLWVKGGWIERALRYVGTAGETSSLREVLIGHLLHTGYFGEANGLLEGAPRAERGSSYLSWRLQALFGLGKFAEVLQVGDPSECASSDAAIINESSAVISLIEQLDAGNYAVETFTPLENKIVSILHASVPEQSGGYAVRAHSVLLQLAEHGFNVAPYTRPGFPEKDCSLAPGEIAEVFVDGLPYRRIGTRRLRKDGEYQYMAESVKYYKEIIRRERPVAVHLRSTYVSALPGLIAARYFGVPVIYEVSGMWELVYESANEALMEGRRARTVVLEDAVLRAADVVCTITEAMGRIIQSRVQLQAPLKIVPNAVDAKQFFHSEKDRALVQQFGWDPEIPVIGYVGSFVDYEGLDVLIAALAELKRRRIRHYGLFVGDGAVANRIRKMAHAEGLDPDSYRFTGRIPHTEVAKMYSLIDICAFPRRSTPATEAVSPMKPFEAMASGKSVIVSNVAALVEIAGGGTRAGVVPVEDPISLADKLQEVIQNPERVALQRAEAAKWVTTERSWEAVGGAFSAEIRAMINRHADGSWSQHESRVEV